MFKILLFGVLPTPAVTFVEKVAVDNFARVESDTMFRANMKTLGMGIGMLHHVCESTAAENQPVIRMNQDTLLRPMHSV